MPPTPKTGIISITAIKAAIANAFSTPSIKNPMLSSTKVTPIIILNFKQIQMNLETRMKITL